MGKDFWVTKKPFRNGNSLGANRKIKQLKYNVFKKNCAREDVKNNGNKRSNRDFGRKNCTYKE